MTADEIVELAEREASAARDRVAAALTEAGVPRERLSRAVAQLTRHPGWAAEWFLLRTVRDLLDAEAT